MSPLFAGNGTKKGVAREITVDTDEQLTYPKVSLAVPIVLKDVYAVNSKLIVEKSGL